MFNYKFTQILVLLSGFVFSQALLAEEISTAPEGTEEVSTTPEEASVNPAIETFGWLMAKQGADQMQFNEAEKTVFINGFQAGLSDDSPIESREEELMEMQKYLQGRILEIQEKEGAERANENEAFFAELKANEAIQQSESGLFYEIIEAGDSVRATDADEVTLHYHGTLTDGTVFDSSVERNQPATFPVSGVVPGFSEGVKLVGNGGKVKLYIPSELGYGNRATGQIPPNSVLVFEVDMIEIKQGEPIADE